jgi:hypothetical protein
VIEEEAACAELLHGLFRRIDMGVNGDNRTLLTHLLSPVVREYWMLSNIDWRSAAIR